MHRCRDRRRQATLFWLAGACCAAHLLGCGPGPPPSPARVSAELDASGADAAAAIPPSADLLPADPGAESPAAKGDDNKKYFRPAPTGEQGESRDRAAARPLRPVRQGALNDITFDDLELDMPLKTLFDRSMLTPRAAALDNQLVRLRGFIFAGGVFQQSGIKNFLLVKNTECKFGPDGLAYCVIQVELDAGVTTRFTTYPVTVEGTLSVRPFNDSGFTWSVYHLQGRRIY